MNMSYCMFENTFKDLRQVLTEGDDPNGLSESEKSYAKKLYFACKDYVDEFGVYYEE